MEKEKQRTDAQEKVSRLSMYYYSVLRLSFQSFRITWELLYKVDSRNSLNLLKDSPKD